MPHAASSSCEGTLLTDDGGCIHAAHVPGADGRRGLCFVVAHGFTGSAEPIELWVVPGFGHAENAAATELVARIGAWAARVTAAES